jgi:outer membrane protein
VKNVLPIINLVLILGLASYVLFSDRSEKKAYVLNQRVFDEFTGKKELEDKLRSLRSSHKRILDSLAVSIRSQKNNAQGIGQYQATLTQFEAQQQEVSDRYTSDIWKRINQYITDYGKENDYTFIFGATGDGGLMFADDAVNITDPVIQYINQRYAKGTN